MHNTHKVDLPTMLLQEFRLINRRTYGKTSKFNIKKKTDRFPIGLLDMIEVAEFTAYLSLVYLSSQKSILLHSLDSYKIV